MTTFVLKTDLAAPEIAEALQKLTAARGMTEPQLEEVGRELFIEEWPVRERLLKKVEDHTSRLDRQADKAVYETLSDSDRLDLGRHVWDRMHSDFYAKRREEDLLECVEDSAVAFLREKLAASYLKELDAAEGNMIFMRDLPHDDDLLGAMSELQAKVEDELNLIGIQNIRFDENHLIFDLDDPDIERAATSLYDAEVADLADYNLRELLNFCKFGRLEVKDGRAFVEYGGRDANLARIAPCFQQAMQLVLRLIGQSGLNIFKKYGLLDKLPEVRAAKG